MPGDLTLVHAIMCGGSGTRLWPWSRRSFPKQFLSLGGDRTLLQETAGRLTGMDFGLHTVAFGNEEHRFLITEQLTEAGCNSFDIILEPEGRNTGPVATLSALWAGTSVPSNSVILLSAADHYIADVEAYRAAIASAVPMALAGKIVTFGVQPSRPETGYGYIEAGDPAGQGGFRTVASFKEKPDAATAEEYLRRGSYYWNAGVFLYTPETLLAIAAELKPAMLEACRAAWEGRTRDLSFLRLDREAFLAAEAISIDHAFMEHIGERAVVLPLDVGWSDIGSWDSLRNLRANSPEGYVAGPAETFDCEEVVVLSDGPLVVAHGIKGAVIVANHDAVYVGATGASRDIGTVVRELERRGRKQAVTHEKVHRPWGWYQTINIGARFQVKEIMVKPDAQLSLQSHNHRSEHWIVVKGTARVTIDGEVRLLTENQSVYIPLGSVHRLENCGRIPMHLIEVQTGSYLEEDDITRYDDRYGRQ
jgi:mannose-1-phosphate guanylyltransferase/mannose-6-phosphate isomerase